MEIIHILKNGEQLEDINGHIVKAEDCPAVYNVISDMIEKKGNREHEEKTVQK